MAVYKRGKKYWIAFNFNRQRYRKVSPDNTYQGAKVYESVIRHRLARGQPLEEPKPIQRYRFKEVATEWLETTVKNNNKPSDYSVKRYVLYAHILPFIGNKYIQEISPNHIELYKAQFIKRKYSEKTINNHLSIISSTFKSAIESGILSSYPKIRLLKVMPPPYDFLTEVEVKQLLSVSNDVWHDMILLAVNTGLRIGEILGLKWEDIDFDKEILTVHRNRVKGIEVTPKSNKRRIIPLVASVTRLLLARKKKNGYVFCDLAKAPLVYNTCLKNLRFLCRKAGLRYIGWHALRHTFASHLGGKPNSIVAIKDLLGHAHIATTMRYVHVDLPVLQRTVRSLENSFEENATLLPQSYIFQTEFHPQTPENLKIANKYARKN